jgi:hypothetical protein
MNGSNPIRCPRGPWRPTGAAAAAGPDRLRPAGLVALCLALTGCVDRGDFGRPRAGFWNDAVLPIAGAQAARSRGEPASLLPLTDAEAELRDRAWRFLMPAEPRGAVDDVLADWARARVLPRDAVPFERAAYLRAITAGGFASPASRYRRIGEDAAADAALVAPFAADAAIVLEADRVRLRGLAAIPGVTEAEAAEARARVAENRCLIAWVRAETARRVAGYAYAVEHAFLAMPQAEAVAAERAVRSLAAQRRLLDALPVAGEGGGLCGGPAPPPVRSARPVVAKG